MLSLEIKIASINGEMGVGWEDVHRYVWEHGMYRIHLEHN